MKHTTKRPAPSGRRRRTAVGAIAVLVIMFASWEIVCRYRLRDFKSGLGSVDAASLADQTGRILYEFEESDRREIVRGLERAQFRNWLSPTRPCSFRLRLSGENGTLLIPVVALGEALEVPGGFVADRGLCDIMNREIMRVLRQLHEREMGQGGS